MHDVVRTEKAGPGNRRNGQLFGQMSSYVIHDLHDFFIFFVLMDITDFFIVDSLCEIYEEFRKNGLFQYIAGRPADGPGLTEPAGRAVYAACFLMLAQNRRGSLKYRTDRETAAGKRIYEGRRQISDNPFIDVIATDDRTMNLASGNDDDIERLQYIGRAFNIIGDMALQKQCDFVEVMIMIGTSPGLFIADMEQPEFFVEISCFFCHRFLLFY